MNRLRRARPLFAAGSTALAIAGFVFACGSSKSSGELEPAEPSWLVPCSASSECAIGECLCGICTEPCTAGDCSGAPAGALCFAPGSVGHAAACGDSEVAGVCLPGCSAGDDCGVGFVCAVGACVPAASLPEPAAAGDAVSRAYTELFPSSWAGAYVLEAIDPSRPCDDPLRCPTLEALLRTDSCFEVRRGCGITYLNAHNPIDGPSLHYWYDAFEAPPLLAYDDRSGEVQGSGGVECDAAEMACWTCDADTARRATQLGVARCADMPGVWPGPPPAPAEVPGCTCEPDDSGGARVSLDCFCNLYECPSPAELLPGCAWIDPAQPELTLARIDHATLDASGQLWLSNARYAGQRYAFDVASGTLVGAVAFSQGPATSPCNVTSVSAGRAPPSEPSEICYCGGDRAGCAAASWFPPPP